MRYDDIFQPLNESPCQGFLGRGIHTLGLLRWILQQTGAADVYVSTFSTSDDFLSGFLRLKNESLIKESYLLADLKASRKTVNLATLMKNCFTKVFLAPNHSKIVLVKNDKYTVYVNTSQNQTYGDRYESTIITTDAVLFNLIYSEYMDIVKNKSVDINDILGIHRPQ